MKLPQNEIADPFLYKVYYALMLPDILHKLGFDATRANKQVLHNFHKRVLGYKTIAGASQGTINQFLFEVGVFWCDYGMFVRTRRDTPIDIEYKELAKIWDKL